MKINTYCPCFEGFYGTLFDPNDYISCYLELNEIESEEQIEFDYKAYTEFVSLRVTQETRDILQEDNLITDLKYQSLWSPRYYNSTTDEIQVELTLTDENIKNIKNTIIENKDAYKQFLKNNYTSHDGFSSFYSNEYEDWKIYTRDFTFNNMDSNKESTIIGSVLEFILNLNYYEEVCNIYNEVSENWYGEDFIEEVTDEK